MKTLTLALVLVAPIVAVNRSSSADLKLPAGIYITSESKTHVHANFEGLRIKDYPALEQIHALFTVYFAGHGATDAKLKTLAQLHFTNLACVVFTDCPFVTDKGIEYVASISSVTNLGLREMSITDAACITMTTKMRIHSVNMPNCTNVTLRGLLMLTQSPTIADFGFSAGNLTQRDLIEIITTSGPKLTRMQIDLDGALEERLDFPALRQAAAAKKIMLLAVRKKSVRKL